MRKLTGLSIIVLGSGIFFELWFLPSMQPLKLYYNLWILFLMTVSSAALSSKIFGFICISQHKPFTAVSPKCAIKMSSSSTLSPGESLSLLNVLFLSVVAIISYLASAYWEFCTFELVSQKIVLTTDIIICLWRAKWKLIFKWI